jgi:hypothetical protein
MKYCTKNKLKIKQLINLSPIDDIKDNIHLTFPYPLPGITYIPYPAGPEFTHKL